MKKLLILLILGLLAASPALHAGKIYKWTDENGTVHYGERAPHKQAREVKIRKGPLAPAPATSTEERDDTVQAQGAEKEEEKDARTRFLEDAARSREEKKKAAERAAREQALKESNCSAARKNLASLNQGGPRFEITEDGERKYFDEARTAQKRQQAEQDVADWCN